MTLTTARKRRMMALVAGAIGLASCALAAQDRVAPQRAGQQRPPNIIIIYADDLGYGDVGAYGAKAIPTPNIDKLARGGLRFTDAHSAAATCTPSRYALLTGEYGFRGRAEILPGDAPLLIRPDKITIADVLKSRGYTTAVVGKWHLGLGDGAVDWNTRIRPGPEEIGFNYSFLLPATGDRVPTVYVENGHVVGLDPADPIKVSYGKKIGDGPFGFERPDLLRQKADREHGETIVNGISRIGYMTGGKAALWDEEEFHTTFTQRAAQFMQAAKDKPFFLFFPTHDPHVPRLPAKRFQGATKLGPRGDAIVQFDWLVGEIMREVERLGIAKNTLIVLSSDNGPVLNDGYEDGAVEQLGDHKPWGPLRGGKYSAYEAGTRVPTIAYWPGRIAPGTSGALLSQVDLFASFAALSGASLPDDVAIDSLNLLPTWLGKTRRGRTAMFEESVSGHAIRYGALKYIAPMTNPRQAQFVAGKGIESGASTSPQLYDLSRDIGERRDLAKLRPADVARMQEELRRILTRTRAEPGRGAGGR
jgi:arylsulfatase A-like enzyme